MQHNSKQSRIRSLLSISISTKFIYKSILIYFINFNGPPTSLTRSRLGDLRSRWIKEGVCACRYATPLKIIRKFQLKLTVIRNVLVARTFEFTVLSSKSLAGNFCVALSAKSYVFLRYGTVPYFTIRKELLSFSY